MRRGGYRGYNKKPYYNKFNYGGGYYKNNNYGGYNKKPYYTLDDFGLQNIKQTSNSEIVFKLAQGDNTDIVISDIAIKYSEVRRIEQESGDTTTELVERLNDISKFIVEYKKADENNWTDATKNLVKFNDDGKTKFKFPSSEGTYNVRIWTIDKNKQSDEMKISIIKSNLTPTEKTKLAENGIEELKGDDIPPNLQNPEVIKAVIKGDVPIPNDSEYIDGTVDTGVVIKYKGSEFVWVPVPITEENSLYVKGTTKPMSRKTSGKDANNRFNYQGVLYNYYDNMTSSENTTYIQGTTNCREPDILTDTSSGDWGVPVDRGYFLIKKYIDGMSGKTNTEIQTQWTKQVQEEYNAMVESVSIYGGFFIGRYETSYNGTIVASVSGVKPMSAETTSGETWYGMYQKQKDFTTDSDKMQANMIWGSQYDAMLNWVLEGEDKAHVTANTYGNHQGSSIGAVECGSYNNGSDKINNIYDLEGNLYEWTQEAIGTSNRTFRAGGYYGSASTNTRNSSSPYR